MHHIRNFSIIAHIDHGKSTLSDRIIQICGGLNDSKIKHQILDSMDLERERGITIKARSVTLNYKALNNITYKLNFIDTPGHVDFSHEVYKSLLACEGSLLVIDASQGVEAQTLSHCFTAMKMGLKIIPVINKIDLPTSDPNRIIKEIKDIIGIKTIDVIKCSAKNGIGINHVIERLIKDIPNPQGDSNNPLQALIIDSWFDNYFGVVSLIRIKNGILYKGDKIKIMSTNQCYYVNRMGIFTPKKIDCECLCCGEVGWLICSIKNIHGAPVGDTITSFKKPAHTPLLSFKKIKPQIYASFFPIESSDYLSLHHAIEKLSLNDYALFYESENSIALGFGFRCGFLGLLHMEIIKERIEREYKINLIVTTPTVTYKIYINNDVLYINNPEKFPPFNKIKEIHEPIAECFILSPIIYLGNIMNLCIKKRGLQTNIIYCNKQVSLTYEIPMANIILDFFNELKSITSGYASLNYEFKYYKKSDIVYINILINKSKLDSLTFITHKSKIFCDSKKIVSKIQENIPRQQFDISIQAVFNNRTIVQSTVKQLRKNVIAKCYGGDVSRKKKLLEKQKIGKKRMKQIGNVKLTQEVFLSIFRIKQNKKYN